MVGAGLGGGMAINPADVTIRYFNRSDIDDLANYFYKSPPGFFEKMGLKIDFFGSEEEFRNRYHLGMDKIEAGNLIPSIITVFFQGIKIGFHTTTDFLENESLVIHGHFFNASIRKRSVWSIIIRVPG